MERNEAYSLLQDEYLDQEFTNSEAATKRQTDRRSVIKEMIGEGYNFEELVVLAASVGSSVACSAVRMGSCTQPRSVSSTWAAKMLGWSAWCT